MKSTENRVIGTLLEVKAFEALQDSKRQHLANFSRRAYLSRAQRDALAMLSESDLQSFFNSCEPIHVPMFKEEKTAIITVFKYKGKKLSATDYSLISDQLPGRKAEDVYNFLNDYQENAIGEDYVSFTCLGEGNYMPVCQNFEVLPKLEKQFSVMSLNSAVNAIAVRKKAGADGRVFIGGCTASAIEYNGPELLAIAHDKTANRYSAWLLDGHRSFMRRPNEFKRETVTCALYDESTDTFITAGYDGRVCSWAAESGNFLAEIGSHASNINSVSSHRTDNILAYGVNSGAVFLSSKPTELIPDSISTCLFKMPTISNADCNTVDWVSIPQAGGRQNACFVGIGHMSTAKAGVIEAWDLGKGSLICTSSGIGKGLSCMQISADGKLLAAGTGCIVGDEKGDGIIRIFDVSSDLQQGPLKIVTDMLELEVVSFCPRTELLFATDSSSSKWSVYDLRFSGEPLFSSSHFMLREGEVQQNEVVAHCWFPGGHYLAAGGHDETVKLWNCRRSFELVDTFAFKNGIAQLEYFEDDGALIVGTDAGEVVWIAPPSHLDDSHPRKLESVLTY